jgi:hypothetical protein
MSNEEVCHLKPCQDGQLNIRMSLPAGRYWAETLNPSDGKRSPLAAVVSSGRPTIVSLRFCEDVALLLGRTE